MHSYREISKTFFVGALMAIVFHVSSVFAEETTIARNDPLKMLQTATDQVLQIVEETKKETNRDSKAFYKKVDDVLSQIVDLEYFARGVMATHASARRYKALTTDEERKAFRERITRFSTVLKDSLMATYADALLNFDGERITWEPPPKSAQGDDVTLTQIIHAKSNKQYKAQYRLKNTKDGWLVQNVIVEGLNLGEAYRNQFADAVEKNKGNVDYVVENWPKLMSQVSVETK